MQTANIRKNEIEKSQYACEGAYSLHRFVAHARQWFEVFADYTEIWPALELSWSRRMQ